MPLAVLLLVAFSAPAEAAKRKVPFGFFGAVLHPMEPQTADKQVDLMARSGVETGRVILLWTGLEPAPGQYEWGQLDLLAAAAARHGIALQPNVTQTPLWASDRQSDPDYWRWPPADPQTFADLMRQLVLRYGPNGSFWAQNPSLPKVPIRQWQIWNEQTAPWNWKARPWGPSYVKLLKGAYKAIHGVDRHATVVAGSLVAPSATYAPWNAVSDLYRYGGKRYFDMIAVHPFTNGSSAKVATNQMLTILSRVRARMNKHHDRKKRIIVTELTWPAAVGRVPKSALEQAAGLSTTRRGQAARLKSAYRALASRKRKLGVSQVYWYAWATEYDNNSPDSVMAFRYSGLNRFSGGVFSREPVLRTYTGLAAKYEGCRKSSNARRCR